MLLFVYGTLKRNFRPPDIKTYLEIESDFVSEAKINGLLYISNEGYPALKTPDSKDQWVYGDIISLKSETVIAFLDEYEDYRPLDLGSSMYERKLVEAIQISDSKTYICEVYYYLYSCQAYSKIESGKFEN